MIAFIIILLLYIIAWAVAPDAMAAIHVAGLYLAIAIGIALALFAGYLAANGQI